jgi:histone H3/H4
MKEAHSPEVRAQAKKNAKSELAKTLTEEDILTLVDERGVAVLKSSTPSVKRQSFD